jgi:hypothetical protein
MRGADVVRAELKRECFFKHAASLDVPPP